MMIEAEFESAIGKQVAASPHVRFQIYQNNVFAALTGALKVRYPVVEKLVGAGFFDAMARGFIEERKPQSAVLIYYGEEFPDYIARYEPAMTLRYLADVARFENAWWHAYHASEAAIVSTEAFAGIAEEDFGRLIFQFHPSAQLFENSNGAAAIWQWHQDAGSERPQAAQEYTLICRPHADVEVRLLDEVSFRFLSALHSGACLEDSVLRVQDSYAAFDLQHELSGLLSLGVLTGVSL